MLSDASHPLYDVPSLPTIPALAVTHKKAYLLKDDGELLTLSPAQSAAHIRKNSVLLCHAPFTRSITREDTFIAFDVLELYAFVYPARFSIPTVKGLCQTLNIAPPQADDDKPAALLDITAALLSALREADKKERQQMLDIAGVMGMRGKGWPWTPFIFAALGETYDPAVLINSTKALNVWKDLQDWSDHAPTVKGSDIPVSQNDNKTRLREIVGQKGETRYEQLTFSEAVRQIYDPVLENEQPHIALAQAGTGVGKTLGYLAPTSVWTEQNSEGVWLSTYTKNLQKQIWGELDRLYTDPVSKEANTVVRKGRENYLCLLNFEDAAAAASTSHAISRTIATGLMARWISKTSDGDFTGAEFHGWLPRLLGYSHTLGMSDKRGECIYAACSHYNRCYVEKSVRKARRAKIVVSNHALVMLQAALAHSPDDMPSRIIFDEGHHLFDAADSTFSAHFTVRETQELRRWLLGAEGGKSRSRGLERRINVLIDPGQDLIQALSDIAMDAKILPSYGWVKRFQNGTPQGLIESYFYALYQKVLSFAAHTDSLYSLECTLFPAMEDLFEETKRIQKHLQALLEKNNRIAQLLAKKHKDCEEKEQTEEQRRLEALTKSIEKRCLMTLKSWIGLLEDISAQRSPEQFIDWMGIDRIEGQAHDAGLYRHYLDPMVPFTESLKPYIKGMAISSATLKDSDDWDMAVRRTGAQYLSSAPILSNTPSPYDYAQNSRVLIINDVPKNDMNALAGAYKTLFFASGGGGLGLFTAIKRLKTVRAQIVSLIEEAGYKLYAQHVDEMDTGTLVDMFREEEKSFLLGTDAVRDGVDIPGDSLKMIVFDRVPWPRPSILHKARRALYGAKRYDEMLTRLRLKQAYGRLIRRSSDKGLFIMMDPGFPSRLHDAFPPDVSIDKVTLQESCEIIREFFA